MSLSWLQSVALGMLQGATEFLPISSSGHLVLARAVLGTGEVPLLFDVLLHVATLAAVCVVFRRRLRALAGALPDLVRAAERRRGAAADRRMLLLLVLASVATAAIGLTLDRLGVPREPRFAAAMLLVTAAALVAARVLRGQAPAAAAAGWQPGWRWALAVGIAQGVAVLPGISRAGATIATAVIAGADRETAAEFSFLAAIPAIVGALLLTLRDVPALAGGTTAGAGVGGALVAGMVASFLVGWLALTLLLQIVRSGRLHLFAFYLVPVGVLGLLLLGGG